jgi:hypothetical protein
LTGRVDFYLHNTFPQPKLSVEAEDNVAKFQIGAYGAFTVGALADDGRTCLELDLVGDPDFPLEFRTA